MENSIWWKQKACNYTGCAIKQACNQAGSTVFMLMARKIIETGQRILDHLKMNTNNTQYYQAVSQNPHSGKFDAAYSIRYLFKEHVKPRDSYSQMHWDICEMLPMYLNWNQEGISTEFQE